MKVLSTQSVFLDERYANNHVLVSSHDLVALLTSVDLKIYFIFLSHFILSIFLRTHVLDHDLTHFYAFDL